MLFKKVFNNRKNENAYLRLSKAKIKTAAIIINVAVLFMIMQKRIEKHLYMFVL